MTTVACGMLIGGVVTRKLRLTVIGNMRFILVIIIIRTVLSAAFFIRCEDILWAGAITSYLPDEPLCVLTTMRVHNKSCGDLRAGARSTRRAMRHASAPISACCPYATGSCASSTSRLAAPAA